MPRLVVSESPLASPELALVDPELGAGLRERLTLVEDTWLRPRVRVEPAPAMIQDEAPVPPALALELDHDDVAEPAQVVDDEPAPRAFVDELQVAEPARTDDVHDPEYVVDVVEQAPAQRQQTSSHYPLLPAPLEPEERVVEETDAALRRIRERLTEELPASKRKFRRRFTVASGTSTACALGVLAVDVHLQIAHLAGWLGF